MAGVRRSNIQHGQERRHVSRGEMQMVGVLLALVVGATLARAVL